MREDDFFTMTNLMQHHTGLPCIIWIAPQTEGQEASIYVQGNEAKQLQQEALFRLSISNQPKVFGHPGQLSDNDLRLVKIFVKQNQQVLLDYWNGVETDVLRLISRIEKV